MAREIVGATVIGKSQNRTALGMMAAFLKMYPQATLAELNSHFSKQAVCPDVGADVDKLIYTASELEQKKRDPNPTAAKWFGNDNACFTKDGEWLTLGNGQKVAFNKMWTATSLQLLQKAMAEFNITGTVDKSTKGVAGYSISYQYQEYEDEPESSGVPSWVWIVVALIVLVGLYFAYSTFMN